MSKKEQKNSNLDRARKVKNDEFYTLFDDIKEELSYPRRLLGAPSSSLPSAAARLRD